MPPPHERPGAGRPGGGAALARLAGVLLLAAAFLCSVRAMGSVLDPDGFIAQRSLRLAIQAGQVLMGLVGLVLLARPPRSRALGGALLVAALAVLAVGATGTWRTRGGRGIPVEVAARRGRILSLQELCDWLSVDDPYLGTALLERYAGELQDALATGDPRAVVEAREAYADVLLRHAADREAIRRPVEELQQALELALSAGLPSDDVNRVRRALGVAWMRAGETQHCIAMHNPARCIFPIRDDGIWTDTSGAENAIAVFEDVLAEREDDLDVRWLLNLAYMAAGRYPDEVPERWRIPPSIVEGPEAQIGRFRDVAPQAGLATFDLAGGVVLDDFDGDGLLDVFTSSMEFCEPVHLYRSRGDGTFEDVAAERGLGEQLGGFNCVQADYDNDGRLDLFLVRGGWQGRTYGRQRNSLLHQRPDGSFEDVTFAAGMGELAVPAQVVTWVDYDLDGLVDLHLGNEGFPHQLFRNRGDGTFEDVAGRAGITNARGDKYATTKGVAWGDYDNDGDPDLYVSNYGAPNRLFRNDGDGTFTDVAPELGMAEGDPDPPDEGELRSGLLPVLGKDLTRTAELDVTFATWFFDYDNDGWLDLYVGGFGASLADFAADYMGLPTAEHRRLRLYHNDGEGGFENVAERLGMADVRLPMGANYGDADNDGWLDVYLGTGRPPFEFLVPNVLYRNVGGERFLDVTSPAGVGHLQKGHGVAFGDLDNDGDQEIFAQMGGFYPADAFHDSLFENPGNGNRWVTLVLRGTRTNRSAIGARLRVDVATPQGARSIRLQVGSGGSFGASSLQQEVGLGDAERIERVEVLWPVGGVRQSWEGLELDRTYELVEGEPEARPLERERFSFPR